ncbi:MAG: hypothetical protein ACTSU2_17210 [Promethearchaeota archaeon]
MNIPLRYIYKYPWLKGGKDIFEPPQLSEEFIKEDGSFDLDGYIHKLYGNYFKQFSQQNRNLEVLIKRTIVYALDNKEKGIILSGDLFNVIFFYTIKTILAAENNNFLSNHVANFMAKIYGEMFRKENDNELAYIASFMGLKTSFLGRNSKTINMTKYPFSVEFYDYIPISNLMKDNSRYLVNSYLEKGHVYLLRDQLIRLLQEMVRREIIPRDIKDANILKEAMLKIPEFENIFKQIKDKFELLKLNKKVYSKGKFGGAFSDEKGHLHWGYGMTIGDDGEMRPGYELFPPCIKAILDKAENGVNLTHNERLHIAFFYANVGYSVEETVDVFRTLPDFDEDITRYNVEFSRAINGKGKKYRVFGCDKLRSNSLCMADDPKYGDEICSKGVKRKGEDTYTKIKSPLDYIFWKRVYLSHERKQQRKYTPKKTNVVK